MKKPRVAYVTSRIDPADPDVDYDLEFFIGALTERGIDATAAIWDDPGIDWGQYDLALIRSTWDYSHQRERFLSWGKSTAEATRLENPFPVIHENTDKKYLRLFTDRGIPTAVVKKPALSEGGHGDFGGKAEITPGLEAFIRKVLSLPSPQGIYADLLYSRVDVVPSNGGFLLMELEVTEPFLFLSYHESAVEIYADAVATMF